MKRIIPVLALAVTLLSATSALAAVGASLKVGTLGVGADVTFGLHEKLNARVNLNYFKLNTTITEEDEDGSGGGTIKPKLLLESAGALLDWHPWAQGFRISAGLYMNNNKIDFTADTNDTVDINDQEYFLSDLGGWATASDPALQSQLNADIAEEVKDIEDDLEAFSIHPVVSLGVSYLF